LFAVENIMIRWWCIHVYVKSCQAWRCAYYGQTSFQMLPAMHYVACGIWTASRSLRAKVDKLVLFSNTAWSVGAINLFLAVKILHKLLTCGTA
jgi:hypothetical protein